MKQEEERYIESLVDKAFDYGRMNLELIQLKTVDKAADIASAFFPRWLVLVISAVSFLFLNLGLAFWLGSLLHGICFGFFLVALFYLLLGLVVHLFLRDWLKKKVSDKIVERLLG